MGWSQVNQLDTRQNQVTWSHIRQNQVTNSHIRWNHVTQNHVTEPYTRWNGVTQLRWFSEIWTWILHSRKVETLQSLHTAPWLIHVYLSLSTYTPSSSDRIVSVLKTCYCLYFAWHLLGWVATQISGQSSRGTGGPGIKVNIQVIWKFVYVLYKIMTRQKVYR